MSIGVSKLANAFRGWRSLTSGGSLLALAVVLGIALSSFSEANAQRQRTYSQTDVERFIRDVEEASREFQRDFDTWLDRSRLDGQNREDQYNREVQNLTSALSNLRSNFDRRNDWWLARNDMVRVLNAASNVNSLMGGRQARGGLNRQWTRLRRNIDQLATAFDLPTVGSSYTGIQPQFPNYGNNSRGCSVSGTWRGWSSSGEVDLTIVNDSATIRPINSNRVYTGRCANDVLYFDWGAFRIARDRNGGISTVEVGNEQNRNPYRLVSGSRGNYPTYPGNPNYPTNPNYPNYPGRGNVPSWMVGTFRGMTDNGESELTINSDGTATARSVRDNTLHSGNYVNDVLTFAWGSYRVVREGNGIRTVDINNRAGRTSYTRIQ